MLNNIDDSIKDEKLTNNEASYILEEVLDTLVEVGNGTTDEDLNKSCDYLFSFRDLWFKKKVNNETKLLTMFADFIINNMKIGDSAEYLVQKFLKE